MVAAGLITLWALTAPLPAPEAEPPMILPATLTVERLPLPKVRGSVELRVDPLRSMIALGAPRDLSALAAKVSSGIGSICPKWEVTDGRVVLRCRTRRIEAAIVDQGGKTYLEIHELRGLPRYGPDQQLDVFYEPKGAGVGGPCPGTTAAGRGECAYHEGDLKTAEAQFLQALGTPEHALGALRLGDMAAKRGDLPAAAGFWFRAGRVGPFGRLSVARLCELRGDCLNRPADKIFSAGEIREPMRTELALRGARIDAFAGHAADVVTTIADTIARGSSSGGCVTLGVRFCRRLLLWALDDGGTDHGESALAVYLDLPGRTSGSLAFELARTAAERASQLGAPVFGGNMLASVAAIVPDSEMPEHLLRTSELFLAGGDRARAQLVFDYAETRLGARELRAARWVLVDKKLTNPPEEPTAEERRSRFEREVLTAEAARDLANAVTTLSRLRTRSP